MTVDVADLDAHEPPSDELRGHWKAFAKADQKELLSSSAIDDPRPDVNASEFCVAGTISSETLARAISLIRPEPAPKASSYTDRPILYHPILPGWSSIWLVVNTCC